MMKRQTICLGLALQFLREGGAMTCAMGRGLCISVVGLDLFQITLFDLWMSRFGPPLLPEHLSPYLNISATPSVLSYCSNLSHAHTVFLGLTLGGLWGVREGARRPLAVYNTRLRINSILNSVTRRGTFVGNSAGVMGVYSCFFLDIANSDPLSSSSLDL